MLVPRVHGTLPRKQIAARYAQINAFERMLSENAVVILKFFLHVSRDEQKRRLTARLADEKRNWKFSIEDLADRERWAAYTSAYRHALRACATRWAPCGRSPRRRQDRAELAGRSDNRLDVGGAWPALSARRQESVGAQSSMTVT